MICACATSSGIETWEAPCFTNLEMNRLAFPACVPSIGQFSVLPPGSFDQGGEQRIRGAGSAGGQRGCQNDTAAVPCQVAGDLLATAAAEPPASAIASWWPCVNLWRHPAPHHRPGPRSPGAGVSRQTRADGHGVRCSDRRSCRAWRTGECSCEQPPYVHLRSRTAADHCPRRHT